MISAAAADTNTDLLWEKNTAKWLAGPVRQAVFLAYKPAVAVLLWEKNTVPQLISRADKLSRTGKVKRTGPYTGKFISKSCRIHLKILYNPFMARCIFRNTELCSTVCGVRGIDKKEAAQDRGGSKAV
jgi:hypothetical protein